MKKVLQNPFLPLKKRIRMTFETPSFLSGRTHNQNKQHKTYKLLISFHKPDIRSLLFFSFKR